MFKLESYIAPILLSYVDKYIKNFRLEDSQVSLWGGDASFHNLDLRLEVLEQELQSPFSFISGHIRELLIHVPWTKLTSEPITITINTIECVLKLKDGGDGAHSDTSPTRDKQKKTVTNKQEVEAPPNYVQLLINKIVNNIRIYCNNLILKYVEEDIVLSMNVKHLKVESCNEKWEAAYSDPSAIQVTMRKVISVNDLTVCLDKRNASGKIDFYQEPMLYRCSMTMHLLRTYSSTSSKTSLTRLDIYCNNMEFSVTEQQVPMFFRLIVLMTALQQKQLKSQIHILENSASSSDNKDSENNSLTWTGWAWSYVTSVLPTQWDENFDNHQLLTQSGHIVQIGFYVDHASLTFKVSETSNDKSYYNQKKIRYYPLLTLQLQGIYSEVISVGRKWSNACFGISEILLLPLGPCSCSHPETTDILPYLAIGAKTSNHKTNSLFDAEAVENNGQGQYRNYNTNWDFHMFTNTEQVLLERSPAFACDFLYQMELPDDASSDILSELGSNLEFSNMAERASLRICCGSLKFRICSGLFHRLTTLNVAASSYDYPSYSAPKVELHLNELLPPSEEDFDALNEYIPTRTMKIMIYEPIIELQFMDHPFFEASKGNLFKRVKKNPPQLTGGQLAKLPKITIECKSIGISNSAPMYINRLVHTTCQLPEPPKNMFEACFTKLDVDIVGLSSRLFLKKSNQTTIIVPFNLRYESKKILLPQYWINPDVMHNEINFQAENLTFNCTKAKLIVVSHLIDNVLKQNVDGLKNLKYSSLLYDACKDHAMQYLELNMEGFKFRKVSTNSTVSLDLGLDAVKAFVFESSGDAKSQNIQQVLFLSGPESAGSVTKKFKTEEIPLLTATLQYPLKPDTQPHPTLVIFNLQEINVCVDPLVCKWFLYHPHEIMNTSVSETRHFLTKKSVSETFSSVSETPRRTSPQIESVHSSSDRDIRANSQQKLPKIHEEEETIDIQEKIYNFLKNWQPVWKSMVLNGHIAQCVIYFPMASISTVGSQGVKQAISEGLKKKLVPNVMVITLPSADIHSAQKQNVAKYLKALPVKLPETIWQTNRASFPWTMSIKDLTCYSMERGREVSFVKTVGLSATVGLSTKSPMSSDNPSAQNVDFNSEHMGCLGVYVHIDVTPIVISVSETQMCLLASLVYGLSDFFNSLTPKQSAKQTVESVLPSVVTVASPSLSPTAKETTLDNTSGTLPAAEFSREHEGGGENVKLIAWLQWTMTKVSIELVSHEPDNSQLKLVIDVEDIVSSLDYQSVYLKLKSKIGSISIQHYKRQKEGAKWQRGDFSGIVMRLREDVSVEKKPEESGFIGITITRASSQHTHNLWGAAMHKSKEKKQVQHQQLQSISTSRFITEIVISVQPIDFVVSIKTLLGFYSIVAPFLGGIQDPDAVPVVKAKKAPWFTNQNLPLAYLECNEIRLIVPSLEMNGDQMKDDVYVVQVGKISLSPTVVNPICRKPIRPDIYRQAAQARVLTVPGSELEDRQYQLDVIGMGISTATWKELDQMLNMRESARGVSENPALEWNNLKQGKLSIMPNLSLNPVAEKIDISIVAAPMMIYKSETIICSSSFEINVVSDIAIFLCLDQIKLASSILSEIVFPEAEVLESKRPSISFPYSRFENSSDDILEVGLSEFYRDSGIDTSEILSVLSSRSASQQPLKKVSTSTKPQLCHELPLEVLFTAGKISFCLYQVIYSQTLTGNSRKSKAKYLLEDEDQNYEASEEESVDEVMKNKKKHIPLIFLLLSQPNAYSSTQQFVSRAHVSCFDFAIKLSDSKSRGINSIPNIDDFSIDLIQTRSGYPDSNTGILPAFFTVKYVKECGKNANFYAAIGRPTKIDCSLTKLDNLIWLKSKIAENFPVASKSKENLPLVEQKSTFRTIKEALRGIDVIQFKTDQLVFKLEIERGPSVCLTIGKLNHRLFLSDRPEKITFFTALDCVTFSITKETFNRLLLNPWTVSVELNMYLESWQSAESEPQKHLSVDSEPIIFDISPQHILHLQTISNEINEFLSGLPSSPPLNEEPNTLQIPEEKDQHYKDDLRAGAFQFIEAGNSNGEELPLPYQVMFWNYKEMSAMAWRYPQPRALTKVRIFPVPLEINLDASTVKVSCQLQFWSEYHSSYVNYAQFDLSETEVCYLELPKTEPQRAVAYIWRVLLSTIDSNGRKIEKNVISPRALAACMRIDSYFNKTIVPNLTVSVHISLVELAMFSNFFTEKPFTLPDGLAQFTSDWLLPESHCFTRLCLETVRMHLASWKNSMVFLDLSSVSKCLILDYSFLREKVLFEQFSWKLEVNLSQKLVVALVAKPIEISFGQTISHTLAVNSQLWNQNLQGKKENSVVVFTKYVVCNDTNTNMRFGQVATDEDLFLGSRSFHMYCWRSVKTKRKLRVAFEEQAWSWSKPFRIDRDGTQMISISAETNLNVIVTIKSLSSTQKQIIIGGQFVIANMLLEHFEFKVVQQSSDDKELKKAPVQVLAGKTITASMFISEKTSYYFRLRFFGLESAWTGDIPLKEHTKGAQPWLVKVPLQERGQFLSIWCRIVVQECEKGRRILAMLWPLFMVKSNLPVISKIHIETPTLNVHLDSIVKGKGELQQLYCPGTIDHSHQLTFKLHDGTSISDPYIPLNYSLVDQQKFFKKNDTENIDEIIESLRSFDRIKWPCFGEELDGIEWIVEEQPQTTIQVKYQNACLYSSALLVELLPWCLMVNTFGCPISLMVNGTELCRLPQYGIVAPPKLDDNFHLGIDIGNGWVYSGPLQLATSDWSQTFYMPTISGTLPLEGSIRTAVKCGSDIAMVSILSGVSDEIRLLKVSSTHIFSNCMPNQIHVVCLAVPDGEKVFEMPSSLEKLSFSAAPLPQKNNSGISIIRWNVLDDERFDSNTNYLLYISFCFNYEHGWSCPVRVDDSLSRKSLSVTGPDKKSIPIVLTAQEVKGQTYLSLYHDNCPQILIENQSTMNLVCAQALSDDNEVAMESPNFKWTRRVETGQSVYYTMPFVTEKFPELPQTCFAERIVFAKEAKHDDFEWSSPISITNDSEQFLKIPHYGDVKLIVKVTAYTTLLCIESVSQVEISAIDIRGRLSQHEKEACGCKSDEDLSSKKSYYIEPALLSSKESFRYSSKLSLYRNLFTPTIPLKNAWETVEVGMFIKAFSIVFVEEPEIDLEKREVANFIFDGIALELQQLERIDVVLSISDIQVDNQLYSTGSYDFPVVLVSQEHKSDKNGNIFDIPLRDLIEYAKDDALVSLKLIMESWVDPLENQQHTGMKEIRIKLNPISFYIEDLYINKLMEYFNGLVPAKALLEPQTNVKPYLFKSVNVKVPEEISWQASIIAKPLNLKIITIEPLSLLLSVHSSLKMYIALDQSPLQFNRFERRRLLTTPYRLGHAMTMHYLSGAIFGAGWVVSSLELLGSPSGLARAMGIGLRDFVSLPYRGFVQGPWAFLRGVTHGSASLMKHVTAGTLQSVTKLASSVARNLDRLTLDEEHLKRTEEQRRMKPQGVTQGFIQGLTGLGISLLGAVGGIAHHPLQSIMTDGASPRSLAAGVGLGLVGVFTKPLSGAAELLALTGQGLLQGAGWNPLPQPRLMLVNLYTSSDTLYSSLKYEWKLLSGHSLLYKFVLFASEATMVVSNDMQGVVMVLTRDALFIVNLDGDLVQRAVSLSQLQHSISETDSTLLSFRIISKVEQEECMVEMDPAAKARVADYVRSTASLLQLPSEMSLETEMTPLQDDSGGEVLSFYVNPKIRNYFICWLAIAKQKSNNYTFPVL